ncbi:MAG: rhombotarget lipoprotein [Desulfobacteraceae bacterium]|nr:rhombotarget lipoprotein [Desulfobacteraceae bacterium]
MEFWKKKTILAVLIVVAVTVAGCGTSRHVSSSLVQYLYPDQNVPVQSSEIPVLSLPLKVGIAFVPDTIEGGRRGYLPNAASLTEKEKMLLMQEVAAHFKEYEFIKSIELLPSTYLKPKGSFANLDQIQTIYGVDVIALLSYDQSQFVDEGFSTISYWTIIGAYMVKGEKNDTHSIMDAAVFDVRSRKMLFRAPGLSHIKSKATPVGLSKQIRLDSVAGFKEASKDLIVNLDKELEAFRNKIKDSPEEFEVIHKSGHTGDESLD